jgi:5-methylcytosine-specific restriction endonuclease McrA
MPNRYYIWAHRMLEALRTVLPHRCEHCGTRKDLTFDTIRPNALARTRKGAPNRACFYRRQLLNGNLQRLCRSCNSRKGRRPDPFLSARTPLFVRKAACHARSKKSS